MRIQYLITVALFASACGGVGIDDFESKLLEAGCKNLVTCGSMPDVATCKASVQLKTRTFETLIAKAKAKVIKYDGDKAGECIDYIENQSCAFEGFYNAATPCDTVFTGTVAAAGACTISGECAGDGSRCMPTMATCDPRTTCCAGTCQTAAMKVALGGDCTNAPCVDTAYCSSTTNKCTAPIATAGTTCDDIDSCANPMYCDIFATAPTCVKPAGRNAMCDSMQIIGCADSRDYCDASTHICTAAAKVGAACGGAGMVDCVGFADCTAMSCVAKPTAGASCTIPAMSMISNCLGDLDCMTTGQPCTLPAAQTACPRIASEQPSQPTPAPTLRRAPRTMPEWLDAFEPYRRPSLSSL